MTFPKAFLPPIPSKLTAYTQESQKPEDPENLAGTPACEEAKQGRCSEGSGQMSEPGLASEAGVAQQMT